MNIKPQPDFVAHYGRWSTVWRIEAVSPAAKQFARDHFEVEDWQGAPEDFFTDHRPANDICQRLSAQGFVIGKGWVN